MSLVVGPDAGDATTGQPATLPLRPGPTDTADMAIFAAEPAMPEVAAPTALSRAGRAAAVLLVGALGGLLIGILLQITVGPGPAAAAWAATTVLGLVPAVWWLIDGLRQRRPGVDVIAVLALVGTLVVGEVLAGAVIAVMLATGRTLEARAEARAGRELRALLDRAPRVAHRERDGVIATIPINEVHAGDVLLIRPGEVVPVDGRLLDATATLDESALTGEPLPVAHAEGDAIPSGVVNAGSPIRLRATTDAAASTYAGIIRLVRSAQASSAPFVRLAGRYAVILVPLTLALAGGAWAVTGDPVRAVAVLVVATPCPLILAAPIAIVAGLSRAARRGVVVKGGSALERLAVGRTLLLDKTGTLTGGHPVLTRVEGEDPAQILRLAASLDQMSPHVLASAIVRAATARHLPLTLPELATEEPGLGVRGRVDDHDVAVGRATWVADVLPDWAARVRRRAARDDSMAVYVAIDGELRGVLLFDDPMRADAARTIRRLRECGIERLVLVTGDRADVAETVGAALGIDEVLAERTPAEKVEAVVLESAHAPTIMVGDGINDAPALAAAGVGVALGARGSTASSEAAEIVLSVDRLDRLAEAVLIARRARTIALQSVTIGMGLSVIGMVVAAAGWLPPTAGALAQEAIDILAIASALRALGGGRDRLPRLIGREAEVTAAFLHEHADLRGGLDRLRSTAEALPALTPAAAAAAGHEAERFLTGVLLPHEEAEEREVYPAVARALGGDDPTAPMVRTHVEIRHQVRRLRRLLDEVDADPDPADIADLQRLLIGLHAILRLHFAQEEEGYFTLAEPVS